MYIIDSHKWLKSLWTLVVNSELEPFSQERWSQVLLEVSQITGISEARLELTVDGEMIFDFEAEAESTEGMAR